MKKKTTLILLSILHICVFCIGILIIFRSIDTKHTDTALSPDTDIQLVDHEPDTLIELPAASETQTQSELEIATDAETDTETDIDTNIETNIETDIETNIETNIKTAEPPSYTFQFIGRRKNLNIRKGPSTNYKIIGKIPPLKSGRVLELTNEDWAFIEYNGITGYSSLHWMELTPTEENQQN